NLERCTALRESCEWVSPAVSLCAGRGASAHATRTNAAARCTGLSRGTSIEQDCRTDMLPAILDDLKVLDLSEGLAGPICAKILADFGADVIKVEPPKGDAGRAVAPFFGQEPHPEKSLVFLLANLNKRGVRLNLEDPDGRELF